MSCCGCGSVQVRDSKHTRIASDKARKKAKHAEDKVTEQVAQEVLQQGELRAATDSPPTVPPPSSDLVWRVAESKETQALKQKLRNGHNTPIQTPLNDQERVRQTVRHARTFKPKGALKKEV